MIDTSPEALAKMRGKYPVPQHYFLALIDALEEASNQRDNMFNQRVLLDVDISEAKGQIEFLDKQNNALRAQLETAKAALRDIAEGDESFATVYEMKAAAALAALYGKEVPNTF